MPSAITPPGLFKLPASEHATKPIWINPELCNTGEIADSALIGERMAYTQSHLLHYRYSGLCAWSYITQADDDDNTLYVPIHMPERDDAGNWNLALHITGLGTATSWSIEWRQTFGSGAYTTLFQGGGICTESVSLSDVIAYDAPSGTGANSVKCLEFHCNDFKPTGISCYHVGNLAIPSKEYIVAPGDCGPGKIITYQQKSYGGLIEAVGTGDDDVCSMERLTRRTFFNQTHPQGSYLTGHAGNWVNMFNLAEFPARCRNPLDLAGDVYCYPAAVVFSPSHDLYETAIRFGNADGDYWTYTFQGTESTAAPIFVHPWSGAGSSSTDGLHVRRDGDDSITIEGTVADDRGELYLLGWALFEGPAY